MRRSNQLIKNGKSKGQVLVLVALIFLILVAFIGLAIDVGMVFVNYANLRRAVDAAALAAATKYRMNVSDADLTKMAIEFLKLNGVDDPSAVVTTCDSEPGLCPSGEERKLVHVIASTPVQMNFISVLGFNTITVTAQAVSEAASLDVILVLDTSESMTFAAPKGNPDGGQDERDPIVCNAEDPTGTDGFPGECHPFQEVKAAAVDFIDQLYFPYDRVGVVTFDRWADYLNDPGNVLQLTNNKTNIINFIKTRQVTPWMVACGTMSPAQLADRAQAAPCSDYSKGYYEMNCDLFKSTDPHDPTTCGTTNIGAGLEFASKMFAIPGIMRQNSLWVVILLTDGAANASVSLLSGTTDDTQPEYFGYCPQSRWTSPFCRDPWSDPTSGSHRHPKGSVSYDSADFAYDMVDLTANRDAVTHAAQTLIYSIGLGELVTKNEACWDFVNDVPKGNCDPEAGQKLLEYAADQGDGVYYYAPNTSQLKRVFQDIAENIAFRLTK